MKIFKNFALLSIAIYLFSCAPPESGEDVVEESDTTVVEMSIVGEEVQYSTDTTQMRGYIAYNEMLQEKKPGILIVHEWWGHTDYVRKRAEMLAELGYVAMALDMYGRGRTAEHPDNAKQFSGMVMKNMDLAKQRFSSAMDVLENHPMVDSSKISVIGYCFGGSLALTMANTEMDFDGVAVFHSGVDLPIQPNENTEAKLLIQNGAEDPFISQVSVSRFKTQLDSLGVQYEYIAYPNAVHAYTNPAADSLGKKFELPLAYNEEADNKSWEKLKAFLNNLYPSAN